MLLPFQNLLEDEEINEILINAYDTIFYEKNGELVEPNQVFESPLHYHQYIFSLMKQAQENIDSDKPFCSFQLHNRRYQVIAPSITRRDYFVSIRKYQFKKLQFKDFLSQKNEAIILDKIKKLLDERKNFLVIGTTGSGKTTFLNCCIGLLPSNERMVLLEDTPELQIQNKASIAMYTRANSIHTSSTVDLSHLIKESLRLRPDRLVIGEIRGAEAKDLVLALSTGHRGSFSTLHAASAAEALLRLEMLIQLGAPQWSLQTIRRMIYFALDSILLVKKAENGGRHLQQISQISGLEDTGFLLHDLL